MRVAVLTDTNSGITQENAEKLGVYILPMPVLVDDRVYPEGVDICNNELYEAMKQYKNISSSQPSPGQLIELWDRILALKKGGRITPAVAALATILNLKPVLTIQGDKLDTFAKARGMKQAEVKMIEAIKKDRAERFGTVPDSDLQINVAGTFEGKEKEKEWRKAAVVIAIVPVIQIIWHFLKNKLTTVIQCSILKLRLQL